MKNYKNRVVVFSPNVSRVLGGISNTAYYLSKQFSTEFDTSVITSLSNNEKVESVPVYSSFSKNKIQSSIYQFITLKKIVKKSNNKLVVFCMSWRCSIIPFLLSLRYNVNYVVLCHGNEALTLPHANIKSRIEYMLRKMIFNKSRMIFANSKYTRSLVREITEAVPVKIIHPCSGEEVSDYNNYYTDDGFILSIGRLEKRKGFQYVIKAIPHLKKLYPQLKYYIAGDGEYKDELKRIIHELDLQDTCIMLGRISEELKKDLLSRCSVFIMPSFYDQTGSVEGFGIVFIEANAYGKPVIGTYSGGIPDAVINNQTGILIKEKSTQEVVKALNSILGRQFKVDRERCIRWANLHNYRKIAEKYSREIKKIMNKG